MFEIEIEIENGLQYYYAQKMESLSHLLSVHLINNKAYIEMTSLASSPSRFDFNEIKIVFSACGGR
jgi:hypothetical protein